MQDNPTRDELDVLKGIVRTYARDGREAAIRALTALARTHGLRLNARRLIAPLERITTALAAEQPEPEQPARVSLADLLDSTVPYPTDGTFHSAN